MTMSENAGTYLFVTGSDMDPTAVRHAYPNARFVARGFSEVHAGEIAARFAKVLAGPGVGDVWGILIHVPETIDGDVRRRQVTTDDGRTFTAVIAGDRMVSGQSHAVHTAARYWELPTGYTGRLEMAITPLGRVGTDGAE